MEIGKVIGELREIVRRRYIETPAGTFPYEINQLMGDIMSCQTGNPVVMTAYIVGQLRAKGILSEEEAQKLLFGQHGPFLPADLQEKIGFGGENFLNFHCSSANDIVRIEVKKDGGGSKEIILTKVQHIVVFLKLMIYYFCASSSIRPRSVG